VHALDGAGLRCRQPVSIGVEVCAARRGSCLPERQAAGVLVQHEALRSMPGEIAPPRTRRRPDSMSMVVAVPALTISTARMHGGARPPAPPSDRVRAAPAVIAAAHAAALASPCSHSGSASKMLVQFTSTVRALAGDVGDHDASGSPCVIENG